MISARPGFGRPGGKKYQAAARGVQQEVEDIRSELVKLLRTLNTTNAGILGAEHELQKKVNVCRILPRTPHPPDRFSNLKCSALHSKKSASPGTGEYGVLRCMHITISRSLDGLSKLKHSPWQGERQSRKGEV